MQDAGRQYDDVSRDAGPDVGRKFDGRKLDGRLTKVGRVELSRRCDDGRWRRYIAAPRNVATMAGSIAARSIVAALADNTLQLAAFFRRYCSNALDVATLLRWRIARWTSQHVATMSGSALGLGVLLRCPTALQQRFCFFFFFPQS